jgi:hypothetical protein
MKSYYPKIPVLNGAVDPQRVQGLPKSKDYYDAEVDAYRRLNASGKPVSSLVSFYGAFTQNETRHIILQYANVGTLEDYWEKVDPPRDGEDILAVWTKLFDLNRALVRLHETDPDNGKTRLPIFQG